MLEHLEGPTLDELLRRDGTLALEQLLPLALHVASALHYMAAEGVVHLDVKPSNVVMGAPPRLIDLSVARTLEQAAKLRSPIGTDAYMAPEQRAPDGRLGPPTDVFGLAATLRASLPRRTPRELDRGRARRARSRAGQPPHRGRVRRPPRAARRRAADADDARP